MLGPDPSQPASFCTDGYGMGSERVRAKARNTVVNSQQANAASGKESYRIVAARLAARWAADGRTERGRDVGAGRGGGEGRGATGLGRAGLGSCQR
jgi:hypothetical protein